MGDIPSTEMILIFFSTFHVIVSASATGASIVQLSAPVFKSLFAMITGELRNQETN